jgi:hypothetical protein
VRDAFQAKISYLYGSIAPSVKFYVGIAHLKEISVVGIQ